MKIIHNMFVTKVVRKIKSISLVQDFMIKRRFPRIGLSKGVTISDDLNVIFGDSCGVNRQAIMLGGKDSLLTLGDGCYIGRNVEIGVDRHIHIGRYASIQDRCILLGDIDIGNYCSFAPNIYISSGIHYYKLNPPLLIKDQDQLCGRTPELFAQHSQKIQIGDDCWIGINVVIMRGIKVGKGVVIGANSVVTKDIPPYSVVAGSPAKVISLRLNFQPPKKLQFDLEQDFPYFYSGFYVSEKERKQYQTLEGMVADSNFTLAMDVTLGKKLQLKIKALDHVMKIKLENNIFDVNTEWSLIEINLEDIHENYLKFSATNGVGKIAIQLAEII